MSTPPLALIRVPGTGAKPFHLGTPDRGRPMALTSFWIAQLPTTQALWEHLMGANPAHRRSPNRPVEGVSWDDIAGPGGFLERLNADPGARTLAADLADHRQATFRLPSEADWEYAARGGPGWTDGLPFSGGHAIDEVAWYQGNSGNETHDVGQKAPNQLGLHDMSGMSGNGARTHSRATLLPSPMTVARSPALAATAVCGAGVFTTVRSTLLRPGATRSVASTATRASGFGSLLALSLPNYRMKRDGLGLRVSQPIDTRPSSRSLPRTRLGLQRRSREVRGLGNRV